MNTLSVTNVFVDFRSSRYRSFKDLRTVMLKIAFYRRVITTFPPWTRVTPLRKPRRYFYIIVSHIFNPLIIYHLHSILSCHLFYYDSRISFASIFRLLLSLLSLLYRTRLKTKTHFSFAHFRHVQYRRDPRSYNHSHRMVLWGLSLGESLSCLFCSIDNNIRIN